MACTSAPDPLFLQRVAHIQDKCQLGRGGPSLAAADVSGLEEHIVQPIQTGGEDARMVARSGIAMEMSHQVVPERCDTGKNTGQRIPNIVQVGRLSSVVFALRPGR